MRSKAIAHADDIFAPQPLTDLDGERFAREDIYDRQCAELCSVDEIHLHIAEAFSGALWSVCSIDSSHSESAMRSSSVGLELTASMKAVRGLLVTVAALVAVRASDVHADEKVRFEIFEQPVDTALLKFAQQAGIPVLFPGDAFVDVDARMLVGEYSVEEGLEILLWDTGVEASVDGHGQLVIRTTQKKDGIIVRNENNGGVGMAEESKRSRKLRATVAALLAGGSAGAAVHPAAAQQQPEATEVDAIVVTGSRIARRDYSSESPILTVGQDVFQNTPAITIEATMTQMPQFIGASGGTVAFPSNNGLANLNLRGLGANRTLVLLDGRRMQPSDATGAVDVNSLPLPLIGSIEVITGGASAVYGSDAIAGVVNFRLADDIYDGGKITYKAGIASRGDGRTGQFGFSYGGRFAEDRGSAVVAVGHSERGMVLRQDRPFFPSNFEQEGGGMPIAYTSPFIPQGNMQTAANPPSQQVVDAIFAQYGYAPGAASRLDRFAVNADGTLFTTAPTTRPVANFRGEPDRWSQVYLNQVMRDQGGSTPLQLGFDMVSVFGKAEYDLSDNLEVYGQVYRADYEVDRRAADVLIGQFQTGVVAIPATNPFIPPDLATLLASRANPNGTFPIQTALIQMGTRYDMWVYDVTQALAGIGGSLPGRDWTWDAHVSHGKNTFDFNMGSASVSKMRSLLTAPDGGASLCEGGYNPFGGHPISESCREYLWIEGTDSVWLEQSLFEGTIQGSAFQLPAGAVGFALGVQYRDNSFGTDRSEPSSTGDLMGFNTGAIPTIGTVKVAEIFGEALVPVTDKLDLGAAYRFSDYDISGGLDTYRTTFNWTPADAVTVRGGYSRAARVPSMGEFFGALSLGNFVVGQPTVNPRNGDPCDIRSAARNGPDAAAVRALCIAQGTPGVDGWIHEPAAIITRNRGNPDVLPEVADTVTAGLVWRSSSANVTGSLDFYSISINDAIGALPLNVTIDRCYNYDGVSNPTYSPDNFYCTLISREPTMIAEQPLLNLASRETAGVDFQLDWRVGEFAVNFVGTYIDKMMVAPLADFPAQDFVGTTSDGSASPYAVPQWKTVATLRRDWARASAGLRWRYLSALDDVSVLTNPASTTPGTPAYNYLDLTGSWDTGGALSLRFGVTNLTDKQPPVINGILGLTDTATYDMIGRSYYVDMAFSF